MFVFVSSALIAALVIWQAMKLPPAFFEPLGPAAFPLALGVVLLGLGLLQLLALIGRRRSGAPEAEPPMAATEVDMPGQSGDDGRMWVPVAIGAATVAYLAALQHFELSFPVATAVYVFAISAPFSNRKALELGAMAIGAILFAYANYLLFTKVLFIDI